MEGGGDLGVSFDNVVFGEVLDDWESFGVLGRLLSGGSTAKSCGPPPTGTIADLFRVPISSRRSDSLCA